MRTGRDVGAMEGRPVEDHPPGRFSSPVMRVSSRARRSPCWVSDFVVTARLPQYHEPQDDAIAQAALSAGVPTAPRAPLYAPSFPPPAVPVSSSRLGKKRARGEHGKQNLRLRAALLQCVDRLLSLDERESFHYPSLGDTEDQTPALKELLDMVVGGVYDDGVSSLWEDISVLCASGAMEGAHTQEVESRVLCEGAQDEKEEEEETIPSTHIDLREWAPACPLGSGGHMPQWQDPRFGLGEGIVKGDWEEHAYMTLAIRRAIAAADVRGEGEEEGAVRQVTIAGEGGEGRGKEEEAMWEAVRMQPYRQARARVGVGSEAGCARLEGYVRHEMGGRRREERPSQSRAGLTTARIPQTHPEEEQMCVERGEEEGDSVLLDSHPVMALSQIRRCGARANEVVRVSRSPIHGLGVFARIHIPKDAFVLEYVGELIRHGPMADKREKHYHNARLPDYQFRVDSEWVVDGTRRGNVARLLNHSCNPNVRAAVLPSTTRIVLIAMRDISAGEELCYDYKFPEERRKLLCHCKAPNCRGFLN